MEKTTPVLQREITNNSEDRHDLRARENRGPQGRRVQKESSEAAPAKQPRVEMCGVLKPRDVRWAQGLEQTKSGDMGLRADLDAGPDSQGSRKCWDELELSQAQLPLWHLIRRARDLLRAEGPQPWVP